MRGERRPVPATPRYGHLPIPMRRVDDDDAIARAGEFCWYVDDDGCRYLHCAVPGAKDDPEQYTYIEIPVRLGPHERQGRASWGWNGDIKRPTIQPSIHTHGHWHGWIRAGRMIEA